MGNRCCNYRCGNCCGGYNRGYYGCNNCGWGNNCGGFGGGFGGCGNGFGCGFGGGFGLLPLILLFGCW